MPQVNVLHDYHDIEYYKAHCVVYTIHDGIQIQTLTGGHTTLYILSVTLNTSEYPTSIFRSRQIEQFFFI